jgi:GrpB-like predicted nucleotidyltransferase (UPF0157 family)
MLTSAQIQWLNKLSNKKIVHIHPYDPKIKDTFEKQKEKLVKLLGKVPIYHRGASSLEISGKNDIDIYIPVPEDQFDTLLDKLQTKYEMGSMSIHNRARFNTILDRIDIEIFLVNELSKDWTDNILFWEFLKNNPAILKKYEKIKAEAEGKSLREYYTIKTEFINEVMELISKGK